MLLVYWIWPKSLLNSDWLLLPYSVNWGTVIFCGWGVQCNQCTTDLLLKAPIFFTLSSTWLDLQVLCDRWLLLNPRQILANRGTACSSMKRESWVGSTNRRSAFCSSNFPLGGGLQCCRPSSSSSPSSSPSPSSPSSRFSAAAAHSPASLAHMTYDNYKK